MGLLKTFPSSMLPVQLAKLVAPEAFKKRDNDSLTLNFAKHTY